MARVYMVDSENVGSSWAQLLPAMTSEDSIYVFYTDKSPYMSYENLIQVIAFGHLPVFVKCYEGNNALDFQLVSELGYKLAREPEKEYVIISDDYGYDAAVRYWSRKKCKVRRIGKKFCRNFQPAKRDGRDSSPLAARVLQKEETVQEESLLPVQQAFAAQEVIQEEHSEAAPDEAMVTEEQSAAVSEKATFIDAAASEESVAVVDPSEETAVQPEDAEAEQSMQKDELTREQEAVSVQEDMPSLEAEQLSILQCLDGVLPEEALDAVKGEEEALPVVAGVEETSEYTERKEGKPSRKRNRKRPLKTVVYEELLPIEESESLESAFDSLLSEAQPSEESEEPSVSEEQQNTEKEQEYDILMLPEQYLEEEEDAEPGIMPMLYRIALRCGSLQPQTDAENVMDIFAAMSMSKLTEVNTALKIFFGNEYGNLIYRELKSHQEYRQELNERYLATQKERFVHYVQIVLGRSDLKEVTADVMSRFLLRIPRKNLNSIRAAMLKEFGQDLGAKVYAVFKPHIKVLNKL